MDNFKSMIRISLGLTIILIAILSTIVSTGLSISYFQALTSDSTLSLVVVLFIILLQSMVLVGSISKGIVYKKTPQHYYTIVRFTRICFLISVLSTISFFNQFDKADRIVVIKELLYFIPIPGLNENNWLVSNLTNMTLIWLSCIVIDLMSMFFPSVGSDLITGISTKEKIDLEKTYTMKLIALLTYYPKKIIDQKCIEYGIIKLADNEKVSNELDGFKFEVSNENLVSKKLAGKVSNKNFEVSKKLADNEVSKNKKLAVSNELEVSKLDKVSNKLANEEIESVSKVSKPDKESISKLADNEVSNKLEKLAVSKKLANEKLAESTKKVSNEKLAVNEIKAKKVSNEKLAEKVSSYIKANYEIEDTIKTKDLLTKFNLNKTQWYKLKKSLDVIETIGTKTKRAI